MIDRQEVPDVGHIAVQSRVEEPSSKMEVAAEPTRKDKFLRDFQMAPVKERMVAVNPYMIPVQKTNPMGITPSVDVLAVVESGSRYQILHPESGGQLISDTPFPGMVGRNEQFRKVKSQFGENFRTHLQMRPLNLSVNRFVGIQAIELAYVSVVLMGETMIADFDEVFIVLQQRNKVIEVSKRGDVAAGDIPSV
jgi:hypothetical protein